MTIKSNDRVELVSAVGFKKLKVGDKGTVIEIVPNRYGQGNEARIRWDTPPRSFTSSIFLTRLRKMIEPSKFATGDRVHLKVVPDNFGKATANQNGTVVSAQLKARKTKGGAENWLVRVRFDDGSTVKVFEDKLTKGAYIAPAAPSPANTNIHGFDRAALEAAIANAKPGTTILVVMPAAA